MPLHYNIIISFVVSTGHYFDDSLWNFQNGSDTDCVYLDYAKAFDKVSRALLLKKLQKLMVLANKPCNKYIPYRPLSAAYMGNCQLKLISISGVLRSVVPPLWNQLVEYFVVLSPTLESISGVLRSVVPPLWNQLVEYFVVLCPHSGIN